MALPPIKAGRRLWCRQSTGRKIRLLSRVELCPSSILTPVVLLESDKTKGAIHRMAPFMLSGVEMIVGSLGHQYAAEAHKGSRLAADRGYKNLINEDKRKMPRRSEASPRPLRGKEEAAPLFYCPVAPLQSALSGFLVRLRRIERRCVNCPRGQPSDFERRFCLGAAP